MCAKCEEFVAQRTQPNWLSRYRKALRGYIPVGLFPGDQPRDRMGRFARKAPRT